MTSNQLVQTAYGAYGNSVEWKTLRGKPMPTWDELPANRQTAWTAAVAAVAAQLVEDGAVQPSASQAAS